MIENSRFSFDPFVGVSEEEKRRKIEAKERAKMVQQNKVANSNSMMPMHSGVNFVQSPPKPKRPTRPWSDNYERENLEPVPPEECFQNGEWTKWVVERCTEE